MVNCDDCGVSYTGDLDRCPLCGNRLEGEPVPAAFPVHTVQRVSMMGRRVLMIVFICCLAAAIGGGILLNATPLSIAALCIALGIAYLFVRNLVIHTPDALRITERYFLVVIAACALWFAATGNVVAATYVLPFVCLAGVLFNTVLLVVQRGAFVAGYAKYLFYNVVLGLAPLALVAAGLTESAVPAFVSAAAAVVLALLLALLARKQSVEEARKLFSA